MIQLIDLFTSNKKIITQDQLPYMRSIKMNERTRLYLMHHALRPQRRMITNKNRSYKKSKIYTVDRRHKYV